MRVKFGISGVFSSLKNAGYDGALGGVIYDDGLARLPDSLEDGGQVAGVGGSEARDGGRISALGWRMICNHSARVFGEASVLGPKCALAVSAQPKLQVVEEGEGERAGPAFSIGR